MKRFLPLVIIAAMSVFTIGCESQTGTTVNKTETTNSQSKDGKTTETKTTTTDTTKTTPPVDPDAGGKTPN